MKQRTDGDSAMSRPKKKPDYDAEKIMTEFLNAIAEAFGGPYDDRNREPDGGSPGLNVWRRSSESQHSRRGSC